MICASVGFASMFRLVSICLPGSSYGCCVHVRVCLYVPAHFVSRIASSRVNHHFIHSTKHLPLFPTIYHTLLRTFATAPCRTMDWTEGWMCLGLCVVSVRWRQCVCSLHTHTHAHMHIHIHTHTQTQTLTHSHASHHTHIFEYLFLRRSFSIALWGAFEFLYMCMHSVTHAHTHIHTHTHARTVFFFFLSFFPYRKVPRTVVRKLLFFSLMMIVVPVSSYFFVQKTAEGVCVSVLWHVLVYSTIY